MGTSPKISFLDRIRSQCSSLRNEVEKCQVYQNSSRVLIVLCEAYRDTEPGSEDKQILEWLDSFMRWSRSAARPEAVDIILNSENLKEELKRLYYECPDAVRECKRRRGGALLGFQPSYAEVVNIFRTVLSSDTNVKSLTSLEGYKAITLIEILDKASTVLDEVGHEKPLLQHCLDVTRKLCGKLEVVPESIRLPPNVFKKTSETAVAGGAYADVYKGESTDDSKAVALKVIRVIMKGGAVITNDGKIFNREAVVWKRLRHRNIVPFHGVDVHVMQKRMTLVSDWMPHGDIDDFLREDEHHGANRIVLSLGVAEGLKYLHGLNVVHGDLKPSNILVDGQKMPRIADFGITSLSYTAKAVSHTGQTGTFRYMAPERFDDTREVAPPVDIYALALVMWELFTGLKVFTGVHEYNIQTALREGKRPQRLSGTLALGLSHGIWNLMQEAWHDRPEQRPCAEELVKVLRSENEQRSGTLGRPDPWPLNDKSIEDA